MYLTQWWPTIGFSQAKEESVSQYLIHAKDYLEYINHASRLSSMDGSGPNHISLVHD